MCRSYWEWEAVSDLQGLSHIQAQQLPCHKLGQSIVAVLQDLHNDLSIEQDALDKLLAGCSCRHFCYSVAVLSLAMLYRCPSGVDNGKATRSETPVGWAAAYFLSCATACAACNELERKKTYSGHVTLSWVQFCAPHMS